MECVDGKAHFGTTLAEYARHPDSHLRRRARRARVITPPMSRVSLGVPLKARLYRNQWIVDCPDCRGAEFAFVDEPVFMCSNCFNGAVDGEWRRVEFPQDREAIEAAIRARPIPANRNWSPGELVETLRAENRAHGLREEVR